MPDYRAYVVGADGRFQNAIEFEAPDDAHAIDQAIKLLNGRDVEVWH